MHAWVLLYTHLCAAAEPSSTLITDIIRTRTQNIHTSFLCMTRSGTLACDGYFIYIYIYIYIHIHIYIYIYIHTHTHTHSRCFPISSLVCSGRILFCHRSFIYPIHTNKRHMRIHTNIRHMRIHTNIRHMRIHTNITHMRIHTNITHMRIHTNITHMSCFCIDSLVCSSLVFSSHGSFLALQMWPNFNEVFNYFLLRLAYLSRVRMVNVSSREFMHTYMDNVHV